MKLRQMISPKKVQATATRRTNASTRAANMEEEEEPTIRFSTAFVVVLLLHMVAFGGVYTFDALKVNRSSKSAATAEEAKKDAEDLAPVSPAAALASAGQSAAQSTPAAPVQKQETVTPQTVASTTTKTPAKAPAAPSTKVAASGEIHVVKKGENPVTIAKHYGVDYETLLTLNKIDDPRRLRIGQKLQIPVK